MYYLPPSFHQQCSIRNTKTEMSRPFRSDARVHIQNGKYCGHLKNIKIIIQKNIKITKYKYHVNTQLQNCVRTSRYIIAQPKSVMDKNIGEATLNTLSLRC